MKNYYPYIIFCTILIIYLMFGYGVTISNDSVTNVDQITALDLWSRSSHFSFHLFGIIFYLLFSKLIGLSAITSIELMLAVFGALGAVSLYQITLKKYNNVNQAVITVIIYSFASGIFRFSSQIEYLILVPSFCLLSLYFYSRNQNLIAGLLFGFGILTSPFAVLFTPMFFLFTSVKEILRKQNIVFALSMIAVYLAVNIFTYQETVSGHWSYGGVFNSVKDAIGDINLLRQVSIYIYGYLRSFNIIIFMLPFVLYTLFKADKKLFGLFIIIVLIHLPVILTEARYGGYQMTAYPIIAISVGYYIGNLINRRRSIWILLIAIFVIINISIVYTERNFHRNLKDTYVQLNSNLDSNSVLIVYQAIKPIKNIYAPNLQVVDIRTNYLLELAIKNPSFEQADLGDILRNNDTVYLLESGQSMPDDHLKLLMGQFTKNQGAKVKGFALEKVLEIDKNLQYAKLKEYPLDVYKLTKRE